MKRNSNVLWTILGLVSILLWSLPVIANPLAIKTMADDELILAQSHNPSLIPDNKDMEKRNTDSKSDPQQSDPALQPDGMRMDPRNTPPSGSVNDPGSPNLNNPAGVGQPGTAAPGGSGY
ncbi:MAG: hypothetical protein E6Q62_01205 [Nitrosomonas sp.]|nr:MAG: hypothetical protein E6Q62_01205 [Nitrosomonas sp.]